MSAPQMKEGPASSMLRAMFAGLGSLMSVVDRVRNKPAAEAPTPAAAPAPTVARTTTHPETVAAEVPVKSEQPAGAVSTVEPEAAPEPVAVAADTTPEPEPATEPESATEPDTASALPLANYDELSVASLRARLRNLSNDDLNQLMTYERAHQDRPEVIKMFQNRLTKMTTGLPKLEE
ncbi:MAG: hypothetical protein QOH87_1743 [Trebonia sp.]|nr:hypothetical protein [Trebonia sp.]